VPLVIEPNEHNIGYLQTKAARMGHELHVANESEGSQES
jgi:hypothetical protein